MCVIFVKGQKEITLDIFEDMYAHNKDGVGICYRSTRGLVVKKSYPKTWEECKKWLDESIPKRCFEKEGFLAAHFRISTSGGVSVNKCHPFMITEDVNKIDESTEFITKKNDFVLFHNGDMSSILTDEEKKKLKEFNDTQLVVANYIAKMLPVLGPERTMHIMSKMTTSRLLMVGNKNYYSCGGWDKWEDHWVSNKSFVSWPKSSGVSYGYVGNYSNTTMAAEKYCYYCGSWTYSKDGVCFLCTDLLKLSADATKQTQKEFNCTKCSAILIGVDEQGSGLCEKCSKIDVSSSKCAWCNTDITNDKTILYDKDKDRICARCMSFSEVY